MRPLQQREPWDTRTINTHGLVLADVLGLRPLLKNIGAAETRTVFPQLDTSSRYSTY